MCDNMTLYYCNAKIRPLLCTQTTNICCLMCNIRTECRNNAIKSGLKMLPCRHMSEFDNERCEFAI